MAEPTLRIATLGNKRAGKTALHTMWYLKPTPPGGKEVGRLKLQFGERETRDRLSKCGDDLRINRNTLATGLTEADRLSWKMKLDDRLIAVSSRDYSGELLEKKSDGEFKALIEEVWGHVTACDGIIFLLDVTDPKVEQLNVAYQVLDRLAGKNARGIGRRPLAIVWMKIDRVIALAPDPADNLLRLRANSKSNPLFDSIRGLLDDLQAPGDDSQVREFAVSAYGGYVDDAMRNDPLLCPPFEHLNPSGIHEPLAWLARRAATLGDEHWSRQFAEARPKARSASGGGWVRPPRPDRAEAVYREMLPPGQVDRDDIVRSVAEDERQIRLGASRWWRRRVLAGVAATALGISWSWYSYRAEAVARFEAHRQLKADRAGDDAADTRIASAESLLDSTHGGRVFLGRDRRAELRSGIDGDRQAVLRWQFQGLQDGLAKLPGRANAVVRMGLIDSHPAAAGPFAAEVALLRTEAVRDDREYDFEAVCEKRKALTGDENAVRRMEVVRAAKYLEEAHHAGDFADLLKEDAAADLSHRGRVEADAIRKLAGDRDLAAAETLYARCGRFAIDFAGSPHAADVAKARDVARQAWFEYRTNSARELSSKGGTFEQVRLALLSCLTVPGYAGDATVAAQIAKVEEGWFDQQFGLADAALVREPVDFAAVGEMYSACRTVPGYGSGKGAATRIAAAITRVRESWFADRLNRADAAAARSETGFPTARAMYLECRKVPGYDTDRDAAEKIGAAVRKLDERWDEHEYAAFRKLPPSVSSEAKFKAAQQAATEYLAPKRGSIAMSAVVRKYLADLDDVKRKGFVVDVQLPELNVPFDSDLIKGARPVLHVQLRVTGSDFKSWKYSGTHDRGFNNVGALKTDLKWTGIDVGGDPQVAVQVSMGTQGRGSNDTTWVYENINFKIDDILRGSGKIPINLWQGKEATRVTGDFSWTLLRPESICFQLPEFTR